MVLHGRIAAEPHNLGKGWVGFDFAQALGAPVRIVNDAAMQAIGSYAGGRMLFLGLGTGLGVTLILDGASSRLSSATSPTSMDSLTRITSASAAASTVATGSGATAWRDCAHLQNALEVDYVVLGGGNAPHLTATAGVRIGNNLNAFLGGRRLWRLSGATRAAARGFAPRRPRRLMGPAPGAPGLAPTWCSSAKEMVGCSLGSSRLWFTIGGGIVNEVYYPRVDLPQIRDLGFIVADGKGFWVEVKRLWQHELRLAAPGAPAVRILHRHQRFELLLRVTPCENRDVLLVEVTLSGDAQLRPYVLLAPHLGGSGPNNIAKVLDYRGRRVLCAEQGPFGLALLAATPEQQEAFGRASAGYVGSSDGWQDFARNGALTWSYEAAGPGNVALIGELPRHAMLALGFGSSAESATTLARTALTEPFALAWEQQLTAWTRWHAACAPEEALSSELPDECAARFSSPPWCCASIRTRPIRAPWLRASASPGATPAKSARATTWCGRATCARAPARCSPSARCAKRAMRSSYLVATQAADGHWNQNQWLGGTATGWACSSMKPPSRCCWPRRSPSARRSAAPRSPT